jgi:polysaccharide transporter, PST family
MKRLLRLTRTEGGFVRRNVLSLYLLYLANYASSLLTLPYLARVLGPASFGLLAASQAYSWCIQMVVEYGFNFSGTKEAQVRRNDRDRLGSLIAEIHGAKAMLFVVCLAVTLLIRGYITPFAVNSRFLWASLVFGLAQGFTPVWIYQGIDRMRLFTVLDTSVRLLGTIAIFRFTTSPADAPIAMEIQAAISVVSTIIGLVIAFRKIPVCGTTLKAIRERFADGASFFVYRMTFNIQMYANPLILSFFAAPQFVAFYSGPERLAKFFLGTIGPLTEGIYPYLSRKFDESAAHGRRLAAYVLAATSGLCLLMSLGLFIAAPFLVHITLGPKFDNAVPVLRILAFLPFVSGLVNSLGIQWMIPMGLKKQYNFVTITSFVAHVALSAFLCGRFQQIGLASSVIFTQSLTAVAMYVFIQRRTSQNRNTNAGEGEDQVAVERVPESVASGVS